MGLFLNLEKSLFLVFDDLSSPLDIQGVRRDLAVLGFTSTSGKAMSVASPMISKKLSNATLGSSFLTRSHGAVSKYFQSQVLSHHLSAWFYMALEQLFDVKCRKMIRQGGDDYASNVATGLI